MMLFSFCQNPSQIHQKKLLNIVQNHRWSEKCRALRLGRILEALLEASWARLARILVANMVPSWLPKSNKNQQEIFARLDRQTMPPMIEF